MIKNEAQNGVLLSYPVEHGDISFKEKINVRKLHGTQGNVITSSAEAVRSDCKFLLIQIHFHCFAEVKSLRIVGVLTSSNIYGQIVMVTIP